MRTPDGSVQLRIVATEAPARNLEYGVTKSLYNNIWEGEVGFSHGNLFGSGERLDLMVRRGTREPHPSFNAKFTGNSLTPESAHDVEAFNEYIGVTGHEGGASSRRGLTIRLPCLLSRRIRGSVSSKRLRLELRQLSTTISFTQVSTLGLIIRSSPLEAVPLFKPQQISEENSILARGSRALVPF